MPLRSQGLRSKISIRGLISVDVVLLFIDVAVVVMVVKSTPSPKQTFRESGLTAVDFMKIRNISGDERHAEGEQCKKYHTSSHSYDTKRKP